MPQLLIRRSMWFAAAALLIAIVALLTMPMVASTQIVRDRIALQLSAWTGYRVEFGDAPHVEVWPTFRAILTDVKFSDWSDPDHAPVIEADRIEVGLSALSALSGNAVLSDARLIRPIVHVTPAGRLLFAPNWPASGRIANTIIATREALAANPAQPDLGFVPDDPLGTVEFVDGQVVVSRGSHDEALLTSLAGSFRWPTLNSTASVAATGIWRGEAASFEASLGRPLVLFAGGASPLSLSLKAAPVTAGFDGTANLSANTFFDGQIAIASPSLRRLVEWSGSDFIAGAATGSIRLSGHASGDLRRVKVENAELTLDSNPGRGVLDITRNERLSVSGSLAFDELDLTSFLYAFTPLAPGNPIAIRPGSADRLDLDIRFSSARATLAAVSLEGLAATLQMKGGVSAFDISDATVFGGTMQAGLRYDANREGGYAEAKLLANDLDSALVATAMQAGPFIPGGRASISINVKGAAPDWDAFLRSAEGTASANFGSGVLNGFDLETFLNRVSRGGFFPLLEIAGGRFTFTRAELKASIGNALLRLEDATVVTGDHSISLMGIVPVVGRGLALSGTVSRQAAITGQPVNLLARFFVGGSWLAPFVSAVTIPAEAALPSGG